MITTAYIFQIIGIAYFAVGLGALINPGFYQKILKEYSQNLAVVYINAFIIFFIGFTIITFHNVWVLDWPLIATVIGWFAFFKGLFMLILPKTYIYLSQALKKKSSHFIVEAALVTIVGLTLSIIGYFVL
ncbi:hypothetical protein ACFLZ1_03605 [Patescibacteria group bacterium]